MLLALICVMGETYTYAQNVFSYNPEIKKSHIIELDNNEKLLLEFASADMLQQPPSLECPQGHRDVPIPPDLESGLL